MTPLQRNYVFFSSDARQSLWNGGGRVIDHSPDAEQAGLWIVLFPETTKVDACYLWTPNRTSYYRYTLPDGEILVEPQEEGDPHRSLFVLTAQMQDSYGMSRKEILEGYPHIAVKDGVKEIVVPGYLRTQGGSIFVSGFGAGRPGFTPLFILFTYHPDGKREIYLIDCDDVDNPAQRYAHLHEVMSAPNASQPPIRLVAGSLDYQLKESYGIDWEHEIAERRAPLRSEEKGEL